MSDFINGTYKFLSIKQNDVYLQIGCLTENSFNESVEMLGTTTRDNPDGWGTSIPVGQKYDIPFSGLVTNDIVSDRVITFKAIRDLKRQRQLIEWKIDDGTGNPDYGQGYINTISDSAVMDEYVSFTGGIVGQGEPINEFDSLYYAYKERVEAAGGVLSSEKCTKQYIESLILHE